MIPPVPMHVLAAMPHGTIAPAWAVFPLAMITLVVVGAHVFSVARATSMPASRRRIRLANGMVMMFTVPFAAQALAWAPVEHPRSFYIWTFVAGLVVIVLLFALLDVVNSIRLWRVERHALRRRLLDTRNPLDTRAPEHPAQP